MTDATSLAVINRVTPTTVESLVRLVAAVTLSACPAAGLTSHQILIRTAVQIMMDNDGFTSDF